MTQDPLDHESIVLLQRASRGDEAALERLLELHLDGLRGYVRLRVGAELRQKESTSDIVQSVCREVLVNRERFQFPEENGFKRWLYATALRKIKHRWEYYRAGKRDVLREDKPVVSPGDTRAPDARLLNCYDSFCSPSREVIAREEISRIERAFDRLPEEYRDVILRCRVLGQSRAEVGQEIGKSEAAVRTLLFRATTKLAEILGEDGE